MRFLKGLCAVLLSGVLLAGVFPGQYIAATYAETESGNDIAATGAEGTTAGEDEEESQEEVTPESTETSQGAENPNESSEESAGNEETEETSPDESGQESSEGGADISTGSPEDTSETVTGTDETNPTKEPDASKTDTGEDGEADTPESQKPVVVVLDPGHGGSQPGAIYSGIYEKDINLKLALYVQQYLSEYDGIEVYMTRTTDVCLSSDLVTDLYSRVAVGASVGADAVISLHCNASPSTSVSGSEVYIPVSEPYHSICQDMAGYILANLSEAGMANRGTFAVWDTQLNREFYAICRHGVNLGIPSIIVEHAYMSNGGDLAKLTDDAKLRMLAQADAKGIAAYFHLTKNGQTVTSSYQSGGTQYQGVAISEEVVVQQTESLGKTQAEIIAENATVMDEAQMQAIQKEQMMNLLRTGSLSRRYALFSEWTRYSRWGRTAGIEALQLFFENHNQAARDYLAQSAAE